MSNLMGKERKRSKEFWRINWLNEQVYTFAKLDARKPLSGKQKTLVNVGSHRGVEIMPYIKAGWRVFAFEPNPEHLDYMRAMEQEHESFTFIPKAVSLSESDSIEFFVSDDASGMSSLVKRDPKARSVVVEATTLERFCREYDVDNIDFLLVDAELKDLEVFQSLGPDTKLGAVTLEFGGNLLPPLHAAVKKRCPDFEDVVFAYRKPLGPDGREKMGVAAKCVGRYPVEEYLRKRAEDPTVGAWGNVLYLNPKL